MRVLSAHQRRCVDLLANRRVTEGAWTDRLRLLDQDAADAMASHRAQVHRQTPTQRLEAALIQGDAAQVQVCLDLGADPNTRVRRPDRTAAPCLALATLAGRPDQVDLLQPHGAHPSPAVADAVIAGLEVSHAHESLAVRLGRRIAWVRLQHHGQPLSEAQAQRLGRIGTEWLTLSERIQAVSHP